MNYEEFKNQLMKDLSEAKIKAEVMNVNGEEAIILGGAKARPTVRLKKLFDDLQEEGYETILEAVEEISELQGPKIDTEMLIDYDQAKARLLPVLTNKDNLIKDAPYTEWMDLYIQYRVVIEFEQMCTPSSIVNTALMQMWGIDVNQLNQDAIQNASKKFPYFIEGTEEIARIALREQGVPDNAIDIMVDSIIAAGGEMYVLSNKAKQYGAGVVLYPYALAEISLKVGGDFYLIPSSINEWLIIRENHLGRDANEIIKEINSTMLSEKEVLSDHIYHYDAKTKKVTLG